MVLHNNSSQPNIKSILATHSQAIAISFYSDNSIAILDSEKLSEAPISRPMGICLVNGGLCVAFKNGINYFKEIEDRTKGIVLYRQSATKYMGFVDGHELVTTGDRIILANTLFNCLSSPAANKDFEVVFKPGFIDEIVPEDRIHLNGIAIDKSTDTLRYVSMFSSKNRAGKKSWKHDPNKGCVWDIVADKPVITDLAIPHSPRIINGDLYICESGKGRVLKRNAESLEVVVELGSFTRGAIALGNYLIVGTSKLREKNKNKSLCLDKLQTNKCGIHLVDLQTRSLLDSIYFEDKKDIFDLQFVPSNRYIVTADSEPFRYLHLL